MKRNRFPAKAQQNQRRPRLSYRS